MITTLWTVSYRVETDTLIHYHTCSTLREVHEVVRRVGYPTVFRISQRDEDYETGYLSVRDLNRTGPPHYFERDVLVERLAAQTPLNPETIRNVLELGRPPNFGDSLPPANEIADRVQVEQHWITDRAGNIMPAQMRDDPMPGIRPGTIGLTPAMVTTRLDGPIELRRTEMAIPGNIEVDFTRPLTRTREQEDRLVILNRDSTVRESNPQEYEEWRRLRDMSPYIPSPDDIPLPRRDRVSVRVVRLGLGTGTNSSWEISVRINSNQVDFPKSQVIRGLLSDEDKHFLPARGKRYENTSRVLQQALREGLQPQSLHDSLKAWAISTLSQGSEATSETDLDEVTAHLLKVQPATLEVGGRVYKLIPAGSVDARPLIARVRKKALAGASLEAVSIREGATRDARVVVSEAEQRAGVIRAVIEQERRLAGTTVPQWVVQSGRAHYWDGSYWNVEMKLVTRVTEIRYLVGRWNTILFWNPIPQPLTSYDTNLNKLSVWLRLAPGNLSLNGVRTKRGDYTCTHINQERCCMELQGLPRVVDSNEGLATLEAHLSRGMRVVNLNSPLDNVVRNYHPAFKAQLPEFVLSKLTYTLPDMADYPNMDAYQANNPLVRWDRAESVIDEARGVFDVNTPVPLVARTVPPADNTINRLTAVFDEAETINVIARAAGLIPGVPGRRG